MDTLEQLRTAARDAYAAHEDAKAEAISLGYVGVGVFAYSRDTSDALDSAVNAYVDAMNAPATFTPEPCSVCDNGHACETHSPVTWADSWLTATERKGL